MQPPTLSHAPQELMTTQPRRRLTLFAGTYLLGSIMFLPLGSLLCAQRLKRLVLVYGDVRSEAQRRLSRGGSLEITELWKTP